jgi:hypothetical protein
MLFSVDGADYKVDLSKISKTLLNASSVERQSYRILDGGYGITWFPIINEDLSTSTLIKQAHLNR